MHLWPPRAGLCPGLATLRDASEWPSTRLTRAPTWGLEGEGQVCQQTNHRFLFLAENNWGTEGHSATPPPCPHLYQNHTQLARAAFYVSDTHGGAEAAKADMPQTCEALE